MFYAARLRRPGHEGSLDIFAEQQGATAAPVLRSGHLNCRKCGRSYFSHRAAHLANHEEMCTVAAEEADDEHHEGM